MTLFLRVISVQQCVHVCFCDPQGSFGVVSTADLSFWAGGVAMLNFVCLSSRSSCAGTFLSLKRLTNFRMGHAFFTRQSELGLA